MGKKSTNLDEVTAQKVSFVRERRRKTPIRADILSIIVSSKSKVGKDRFCSLLLVVILYFYWKVEEKWSKLTKLTFGEGF